MRYVIYGAGAVGGVIGARLFEHGHDVTLIARGAHLDAIRDRGLTLETTEATSTLPIPVVGHPSEVAFTRDDVVLMTMKTQDAAVALDDLRIVAGANMPVICAQNGVENERMASRRFARVYAMLVVLPATYLQAGVVQAHASPISGVLDAGCYPSGIDDVIVRVTADLDHSGLSARPVDQPMRLKYAKLLSNLSNALQAACDIGDESRGLYMRAYQEAIACYKAAHIKWTSDAEMAQRRTAMSPLAAIAGSVRAGGSSWQSLARGTGTIESDYLNGEIALLGRLHGVPTPVNSALQRVAMRMARDHAAPGSMTAAELEREIGA